MKKMTNKEVIEWFKTSAFYHKDHTPFNMAIEALESQKTGKWVYEPKTDLAKCSECGTYCPHDMYGRIETNFCPYCGAKMEE